jgi:hypothetical protein
MLCAPRWESETLARETSSRVTRANHRSVILPVAAASTAVVVALAWQSLTIHFNREGQWTALYCTGAALPVPPSLAAENVYRFPGTGYDGQFYHYLAHDPGLGPEVLQHLDDPRVRSRRILVPALAHALALGRSQWVDPAYLVVVLLFVFAGAYWSARLAVLEGWSAAFGVAFLLIPATLISLDRMTADVALAALSVALWLYSRSVSWWRLFIVLALAPLVRETGLILVAAASLAAFLDRRPARGIGLGSAALPSLAWYAFVHSRTPGLPYPVSFVPLSGIITSLIHPALYADKLPMVARLDRATDALALLGVVTAFVLAWRPLRERRLGPGELAGMLFAALGLVVQRVDHWGHVFDFGRVYSPLLVFLLADSLRTRRLVNLAPVLLMYPRILLQLGSQIVGVVLGLAGL